MNQITNILKRNSLLMALIAVMIFFEIIIRLTDHGSLFSPANFTNIISNRAQSLKARLWMPVPDDTEGRIVHFICQRCEQSNGKKALKIKMEELARITNDTRLSISKALNKMQQDGWIELHRGEIVIPELKLLTENCL